MGWLYFLVIFTLVISVVNLLLLIALGTILVRMLETPLPATREERPRPPEESGLINP